MRRLRFVLWIGLGAILLAGYFILGSFGLIGTAHQPRAREVPHGDQEIVYIQAATSGSTWERFVTGIHRVKKDWPDLIVDDRNAFPEQSAAVPEVALRFPGVPGRLWIRWYKMTSDAGTAKWIDELARRDPPPLAIIGGGSSDRARDLAEALEAKRGAWHGAPPLLLITTATADNIELLQKPLITLYKDRSYRFCFSNSQMAEAVWDFVWTQDDLRPYARPSPLNPLLPAAGIGQAAGGDLWGCLPWLIWGSAQSQPYMVHIVEWSDDPYSRDLAFQFRMLFSQAEIDLPSNSLSVPYSVGGVFTPNPPEARVVKELLKFIPPHPDERFLLILPAVDKPVRRVLRSLALAAPREVGNFVVVTGDSIPFSTLYRDRHMNWNIQELPFPLVAFCHHNPVAWDEPNGDAGPRPNLGTDDELLNAEIVRLLVEGCFRLEPPGEKTARPLGLIASADELNAEVRCRRANYFGPEGNRLGGSGEFLVCLRPVIEVGRVKPEATIEVWTRRTWGQGHRFWRRVTHFKVDYTDGPGEVLHGGI
jgi:hypothetical protein